MHTIICASWYLLMAVMAMSMNGSERSHKYSMKLDGRGVGGRGRTRSVPTILNSDGSSLAR